MKFFAVLLPLVATVIAVPATRQQQCTNPEVWVEWHSLTQDQRLSYHNATKCLQTTPSGLNDGQSLYDRFAKNHVDMFDNIHYVAVFLPWHRYYLSARARALRNCKYNGPIPFWDWTKDVKNMTKSEIFDPIEGFGGSGSGDDMCVRDGPYGTTSNFTLNWPEKRCLRRNFQMNHTKGSWWRPATGPQTRHSQTQVDQVNKNNNFTSFWPALEENLHDPVHNEINNDMAANFSPDDALFFLHHANVDRLWALWQAADTQRLREYAGNTVQGQPMTNSSGFPLATLDDTVNIGMDGFPPVKVRDLMDTQSSILCYKYDN